MPSSRQQAKAQNGRIRLAVAALVMASAIPSIGGNDISSSNEGARVEINGGRKKDAAVSSERHRRKRASVEIDLADSKDVAVEINAPESKDTAIAITGRRARTHFKSGRRYLFAQQEAQFEEPALPPSQFNPDPGGGNLVHPEPAEPPDLFPPILPQPPEYGDEPVPRSLRLPRRGIREIEPERHKLDYQSYPEDAPGLPASEPVPNRWFIGFGRWQRYADPATETTYQHGALRFWHPYLQSKLKGDAPIIGQDIFLNLTLNDFFQFATRKLPIPSGVSTARPNSSEFFGRSEQLFWSNDFSIGIDLFKGETAFKPVVWALRFLFVANQNYIRVKENNALDPDPRGPGFTAPPPVLTFPPFRDP